MMSLKKLLANLEAMKNIKVNWYLLLEEQRKKTDSESPQSAPTI